MSKIVRINSGARMSDAVVFGDRVYLSGVVAESSYGKSVYEQTVDVLAQIDELLLDAGSDKVHILKANIWLADIKTFAEMNKAWDAWVVAGKTPVRATVEAKLADAGYGVEIMVEAVVK
jgi:enamine deaminase RidA (YjgF/YER057c/UK114 family)